MGKVRNFLSFSLGKSSIILSKIFKKSATALPGKVALTINPHFLSIINERCEKIILITGTNGKTTTNNLINHILDDNICLSNLKGANMAQGVATTIIKNRKSHYDYGIFEVDEGSLDFILKYLNADYIILTNFFRDQLDRYGEIDGIINEVYEDVKTSPHSTLIINTDDLYINQFKQLPNKTITFGLNIDTVNVSETNLIINKCPLCGNEIEFLKRTYGHLGDYKCNSCGYNNHEKNYQITDIQQRDSSQIFTISSDDNILTVNYPYTGLYNAYNVLAAYSLAKQLNMSDYEIVKKMENFSFSLGRMEEFTYKNKIIKVILTKNPIGLSQATNIISNDSRQKSIVHILNDNPADGQDISWIWDANTRCDKNNTVYNYYCTGRRAEEIALKKKYDDVELEKISIIQSMTTTIDEAIEDDVEILYVLPTYTAVFETRDYIEKIVNR